MSSLLFIFPLALEDKKLGIRSVNTQSHLADLFQIISLFDKVGGGVNLRVSASVHTRDHTAREHANTPIHAQYSLQYVRGLSLAPKK